MSVVNNSNTDYVRIDSTPGLEKRERTLKSVFRDVKSDYFDMIGMDFTHKQCFSNHIRHIGTGLKDGTGEIVSIVMPNVGTLLYKVTAKQNGTRQDWSYKFQGYSEA